LSKKGFVMPHRQSERNFLRQRWLSGTSMLMLAMRRTGKTWLCHKLEEDAKAKGYSAAYCDLEGREDERAVFSYIYEHLECQADLGQLAKDRLGNFLRRILTGQADASNVKELLLRTDPREALDSLLAVLSEEQKPWLIILDELPLFVMKLIKADRSRAESFLYQLRAYRQKHPTICWIMTGSVGLDVIERREKLGGPNNDLERFDLQPFSPEAARMFIEIVNPKCPHPFALDDEAFRHLVQRLSWLSPYYLERVAVAMRPSGAQQGDRKMATIGDIDRAFEALLAHAGRGYFAAWVEHIDKNFIEPERQRLRIILSRLSAHEEGETFDTLLSVVGRLQKNVTRRELRDALDVLGSDGYLDERTGRYRFVSGLVRLWWNRWEADDDGEGA
jgi:hypothetical protein